MKTRAFLHRVVMFVLSTSALQMALTASAGAQLANTPWPMLQHDPQHTGRSGFLGPLFPPEGPPPGKPADGNVRSWQAFGKIVSAPTIGSDGTIYVGVDVPRPGTSAQGYLCAINPDMTQKWCKQTRASASQSSAAIDANGIVYLGDRDNTLTAFDPALFNPNPAPGEDPTADLILWRYNHGFEGDVLTSPAVGQDGTIYFAFSQNLFGAGVFAALYPEGWPLGPGGVPLEGTLKSKYVLGYYIDASSPAIDQSGALYLGDVTGVLHKFLVNGTLTTRPWKVKVGTKITASPVIGSDGTIYIGSWSGLTAVSSSGAILWTFPAGIVDQTAALGSDDTIYVSAKSGTNRVIYAVAKDGTLRWQYGPVYVASPYGGFPIVGADGTVYVGFGTGVYAFSPDGVLLWTHNTGSAVTAFPAIAGTASKEAGGPAVLYVPSSDWKLYAISNTRAHGTASNNEPVAHAGSDQTAAIGQVVQFSGWATDADLDVMSFTWDFGDGKSAIGPTAHHAYLAAGTYTVTLTVSDGLST